MRKWEYAAITLVEANLSVSEYDTTSFSRWVLTSKTSTRIYDIRNHSKLDKLQQDYSKYHRNPEKQDERNKTRQKRNDELFRIFDNNELPNVIITGLDGEDDLDLIRMAAAEGWETTGRTPATNLIMMRRRVDN